MEDKNRLIDLKQVAIYICRRIWIVIILMGAGCAFLAVRNYNYQKERTNGSKAAVIDTIISQNHRAYYYNGNKYTDAEVPSGAYNSSAKLYVDFDYSDVENNSNNDFAQMNMRFENDAMLFLMDKDLLQEVIDELNLKSYGDMKNITPDRLQWMINKNFMGAHIMNVVISDSDPERARKICECVINKFMVKAKDIMGLNEVRIVETPTLPNKHSSFAVGGSAPAATIDKKAVLKRGIIGAVAGFVVAAMGLFIIYVLNDVVRSEADLHFAGIKMLKGAKKRAPDEEWLANYINLKDGIKKVMFVAVDNKVNAKDYASKVIDEMASVNKNIEICVAEDFRKDIKAVKSIKTCDAVVYLTKYNKTKMADLLYSANVLDEIDIKCLGGILL